MQGLQLTASDCFFLFHGHILEDYHLIPEIHHVFESCRVVGVICFMWVAIGCTLKQGIGICSSATIGGDCLGVVFSCTGLCTDSVCGFWGLVEAQMVTIFLAVIVFGCGAPGKVFFYLAKVVAYCN
jgi:hypothetical protein